MTIGLIVSLVLPLIGIGAKLYFGGKTKEKLKQAEAINDQNDELLDFVKKQKDFEHRVRSDPDFAKRVLDTINDNKK